ncbi:MAG: hypothetical protein FJX42_06195 [Alphaproteobacteria bacterium]|nr:hypothetical protein [Alphaproteobacteria bacterium]
MANADTQRKWRAKNHLVKRQLNVTARRHIHDKLADFAGMFQLRGKAEAVTFACFITEALIQRADYSADVARMLDDFRNAYHRDREMFSP